MYLDKLILVTSNLNKLSEFKRYGIPNLHSEEGKDLKEIQSDEVSVVIYKAKDAGTNHIVEDTSLHIEGENVGVNIKWLINNLNFYNGKKAIWKTLLGVNDEDKIYVYEGTIEGIIDTKLGLPNDSFGFDSYFIPNTTNKTLYELEKLGMKDSFSARKNAINNLLNNNYITSINISEIKLWNGDYQ